MFDPSSRLLLRFRGKTTGPFTLAQVEQMRQLGRLTAFHEVSSDGVVWHLAADAGLIASTSMPQGPAPVTAPSVAEPEPAAPTGPAWYYLDARGGRQGPLSRAQIGEKARAGELAAASEVWCEGMADWASLGQTDLAALLPQTAGAAGPGAAGGNGVVVAGYLCCVAALFLCPPLFGPAALTCAIVNLGRGRVPHGLAQLFLSIVLTCAGSFLWYLVYLELSQR